MKNVMLLCLVLALALPGCGKGDGGGQNGDGQEQAKSKTDGKDRDLEVDTGVFGKASVPEGFPDDVYVYEGATVVQSLKQGDNYTLTLRTSDDAAGVLKAYEDKAKANGWEEKLQHQMGSTAQRHFAKGDRKLAVVINASEDGTVVNIVTTPK